MRMGTSRLENFDPEHGDVLVLPQAQAEQLFELGAEIGGPILWELLAWFLCKSEGVMEDVRDNVFLRGLVDNQKLYARKTFDRLSQQKANAESRWRRDEHATACHGMPLDAEAAKKGKEKAEEKPKASLHPSPDSAPSEDDACGVVPGASFPSPRYLELRKGAERHLDTCEFTLTELDDLARDPTTAILRHIGEGGNMMSRNALNKFIRQLGQGTVVDTFLDMVVEDDVKQKDLGKTLFGRLKGIVKTRSL